MTTLSVEFGRFERKTAQFLNDQPRAVLEAVLFLNAQSNGAGDDAGSVGQIQRGFERTVLAYGEEVAEQAVTFEERRRKYVFPTRKEKAA